MHGEFPELTFDITTKVEHILKRGAVLPELGRLGCLFLISAVESVSDAVLAILEKNHTRLDIVQALEQVRAAGIAPRPTWVAFTPWTTPSGAAPTSAATELRARSTLWRAARPQRCTDEGLPQRASAAATAAAAAGRNGAVAFQSR